MRFLLVLLTEGFQDSYGSILQISWDVETCCVNKLLVGNHQWETHNHEPFLLDFIHNI